MAAGVSVVVTSHDRPELVVRAVETALAQTCPHVEVVVVDDGSIVPVAGLLAPRFEGLQVVRHDRPLGVSAARNTGIARSTGEFVAFLDDDDWWPPELVSRLAERAAPGTAVIYDSIVVDSCARKPETPRTLLENLPAACRRLDRSNMARFLATAPLFKALIHRADVERVGGYNPRFDGLEDFHFFAKLLAAGVELRVLDEPKGFYLVHPVSITNALRRAPRHDFARRSAGIVTWLELLGALPGELDLSPQARRVCRRRRRYWRARLAQALLVDAIVNRSVRRLRSRTALATFAIALPRLALLGLRGIALRLQGAGA